MQAAIAPSIHLSLNHHLSFFLGLRGCSAHCSHLLWSPTYCWATSVRPVSYSDSIGNCDNVMESRNDARSHKQRPISGVA